MINQRLIKATLLNTAAVAPDVELAKRLAEQRKIQRRAERDIADWLYCQFLSTAQADGQCFTGEVQDINRTGVRLRLLENGAQGFLALSELGVPADSLSTNWEEGRCYQGDHIMLELGQQLQVQISEINPESQTINLKLPAASADL